MKTTPQQKSLLNAITNGKKLSEVMREPGMPSYHELERWRTQNSFNRLYQQADHQGRIVRDGPLNSPAEGKGVPAVLRGSRGTTRPFPPQEVSPAPKWKAPVIEPELVELLVGEANLSAEAQPRPVVPVQVADLLVDVEATAGGVELVNLSRQVAPPVPKITGVPLSNPSTEIPMSEIPAPEKRETTPVLRYFYPQKINMQTGNTSLMFVYKKKNPDGIQQSVNFQTGISLLPEQWDKVAKRVKSTCQDHTQLNERLDLMHELAMMAIAEGKTQNEVRAILDLDLTKPQKTYDRPGVPHPTSQPRAKSNSINRSSPAVKELVNTAPIHATPVEPDLPVGEPETLITNATPMSEAAAPSDPNETNTDNFSGIKPSDNYFLVNESRHMTQEGALQSAWALAQETGEAVTIYEVKKVALGTIQPAIR